MVEDTNLQEIEEKKVEEEVKAKEEPKGYYLAEVPVSFEKVIALNGKQVSIENLIIKMANALTIAGLLK